MKLWFFGFLWIISVAISSETDVHTNSSEALKVWRRVRNFAEPAIVTPQSPAARGNGQEHDGGKEELRKGAREKRGLTAREARCERVGGGVGKAVSVPGPHTPICLASSYYYMCPHYYWRRLQMSCAASPAAALIPTDKINSVVRTDL
jgi:hypothetical protein